MLLHLGAPRTLTIALDWGWLSFTQQPCPHRGPGDAAAKEAHPWPQGPHTCWETTSRGVTARLEEAPSPRPPHRHRHLRAHTWGSPARDARGGEERHQLETWEEDGKEAGKEGGREGKLLQKQEVLRVPVKPARGRGKLACQRGFHPETLPPSQGAAFGGPPGLCAPATLFRGARGAEHRETPGRPPPEGSRAWAEAELAAQGHVPWISHRCSHSQGLGLLSCRAFAEGGAP